MERELTVNELDAVSGGKESISNALADSELDAVNGGLVVIAVIAVLVGLLVPR